MPLPSGDHTTRPAPRHATTPAKHVAQPTRILIATSSLIVYTCPCAHHTLLRFTRLHGTPPPLLFFALLGQPDLLHQLPRRRSCVSSAPRRWPSGRCTANIHAPCLRLVGYFPPSIFCQSRISQERLMCHNMLQATDLCRAYASRYPLTGTGKSILCALFSRRFSRCDPPRFCSRRGIHAPPRNRRP